MSPGSWVTTCPFLSVLSAIMVRSPDRGGPTRGRQPYSTWARTCRAPPGGGPSSQAAGAFLDVRVNVVGLACVSPGGVSEEKEQACPYGLAGGGDGSCWD